MCSARAVREELQETRERHSTEIVIMGVAESSLGSLNSLMVVFFCRPKKAWWNEMPEKWKQNEFHNHLSQFDDTGAHSPGSFRCSFSLVLKAKAEQVMQLTAQRNSHKNRADSLAKDLSRVCGNGRTIDQIEIIVTK